MMYGRMCVRCACKGAGLVTAKPENVDRCRETQLGACIHACMKDGYVCHAVQIIYACPQAAEAGSFRISPLLRTCSGPQQQLLHGPCMRVRGLVVLARRICRCHAHSNAHCGHPLCILLLQHRSIQEQWTPARSQRCVAGRTGEFMESLACICVSPLLGTIPPVLCCVWSQRWCSTTIQHPSMHCICTHSTTCP